MLKLDQEGQTLIEVLIALTIGILIIGALAIATITSIRNSQFSLNQLQATKLAQEGMEAIRTVRDRNGNVSGTTPVLNRFSDLWLNQFGQSSASFKQCLSHVDANNFSGFFKVVTSDPSMSLIHDPPVNAEVINNQFRRYALVEDGADFQLQKRVTVVVCWSDTSGTHESNLQTVFTKQDSQ